MNGCNLELLDLSGSVMSTITDEGVKYVAKHCHNLQVLGRYKERDLNLNLPFSKGHFGACSFYLYGSKVKGQFFLIDYDH